MQQTLCSRVLQKEGPLLHSLKAPHLCSSSSGGAVRTLGTWTGLGRAMAKGMPRGDVVPV